MYLWHCRFSRVTGIPLAVSQVYLVDPWLQTKRLRSLEECWPRFWSAMYRTWLRRAGDQFSMHPTAAARLDYPLWYTSLTAFGPSRVWSTLRACMANASLPVYWSEVVHADGSWRIDAFVRCTDRQRQMLMWVLDRHVSLATRQTLFWPCSNVSALNYSCSVNRSPLLWSTLDRPIVLYRALIREKAALPPFSETLPSSLGVSHPRTHVRSWPKVWRFPVARPIRVFLWELQRGTLRTSHLFKSQDRSERLCVCRQTEETPEHLFWSCPLIHTVFQDWWSRWGFLQDLMSPPQLQWPLWRFYSLYRYSGISVPTEFAGLSLGTLLHQAWTILLWVIWLERNRTRFDGLAWSLSHLKLRYNHLLDLELQLHARSKHCQVMSCLNGNRSSCFQRRVSG